MDEFEFTYEEYAALLDSIQERGYTWTGYRGPVSSGEIVVRHDVDYSPRKARKLAEIEAERGCSSVFFFLVTSPFYNVLDPTNRSIIRDVERLGHSVGLHFSHHAYWEEEPSLSQLEAKVAAEQDVLGVAAGDVVPTVSFHNPPECVLGRRFESFTSTYEPRFFETVAYETDSNQRWRNSRPFDNGWPDSLQLLTHPVLWGAEAGSVVDRLREEREYVTSSVERAMEAENSIVGERGGLDRSE